MAKISVNLEERVFQIKKWGGLRESPDGDAGLAMGEASVMENFKVTRDGNLQIRPGTRTLLEFEGPIRGMWHGYVAGREVTVCAAESKVWELDFGNNTKTEIGLLGDSETFFFGFQENLYMLNGQDYRVWDGSCTVMDVVGYRPLVSISVAPSGGGTLLERVNLLNGTRRCWFSPDGAATTFHLPEADLKSIDYVRDRATGADIPLSGTSLVNGTFTTTNTLPNGTNTIEVGWTVKENFRYQVEAMRFAEIYNGTTDNRVFFYGDGTNRSLYTGLDYDGNPTAEYIPDLNVLDVGSANTPITSMIRHYSRLIAFKTDSTYTIRYSTITLEDNTTTAAFYCTPANRSIGNVAPGQVQLVLNNPYTLHGSDLYMWRNNSSYSSNLTTDERQAKVVSDRVYDTLGRFDMKNAKAFDDNYHQEYYVIYNGVALVLNYAADAWYKYTNFPFTTMVFVGSEVYGGTEDGRLMRVSRDYGSDDTVPIESYWRSGSMDFGRDWMRKYSAKLYVAMEPEAGARVDVTVRTNRKSDFIEKRTAYSLATFQRADFRHWSFRTNHQPQITRMKIKAKKFAFYQLVFKSVVLDDGAKSTATILGADIKVRYTGDGK